MLDAWNRRDAPAIAALYDEDGYTIYCDLPGLDKAISHEATLKLSESRLGPDHPHTLTYRNNLAAAYVHVYAAQHLEFAEALVDVDRPHRD